MRQRFRKWTGWWTMSWSGWTVKWTSRVNRVSPWSLWWKRQRYRPKHGSVTVILTFFLKYISMLAFRYHSVLKKCYGYCHNFDAFVLNLFLFSIGAVLQLQSHCDQTQAQSGLAKRRKPVRTQRAGQYAGKPWSPAQRHGESCCWQCRRHRSQAWNGPRLTALCNVMLTLHVMLCDIMFLLTYIFPVTANAKSLSSQRDDSGNETIHLHVLLYYEKHKS